MILFVPRAATTSDPFNAVAEPRRREILEYLAPAERSAGESGDRIGVSKPCVSKPLGALRNDGLVHVRREVRNVLYRTNADALRPLHEWTGTFQRYWSRQLRRIQAHAEAKEK